MKASYRLAPIVGSLMLYTAAADTQDLTPQGIWLHDNERIQVEIAPCGVRLCGRIVWLKNPYDETGAPRTDSKNPDPRLRDRPLLGLTVLRGLRPDGRHSWTDGSIYNPDDGDTYRCRLTMQDDRTLQVRAFVLLPIFGKTLVWTRVREPGEMPDGHLGRSG